MFSYVIHIMLYRYTYIWELGFSGSSAGKESACNAGDPGLISGSERSTREAIGYSLQYSWTSLVAQRVKNPPAMRETWVWSLGLEDPLEEGMATHSTILAWRIPMDRGAWQATVHGVKRVGHDWAIKCHRAHVHTMIVHKVNHLFPGQLLHMAYHRNYVSISRL